MTASPVRRRWQYPGWNDRPLWSRLSRWRMRRAMPTSEARAVFDAYGAAHAHDMEAVVGELIARLEESGALRDTR